MTIKTQWIIFYTILRREILRMVRIVSQVFFPPVITTTLYFMIFGSIVGQRIGDIQGVSYAKFIAPGLIMMSMITNAYGNVSTSLFNMRFQRSIEEMLVSPMSNGLLLLGYITGGIFRGFVVAILVYLVACFFVDINLHHTFLTCLIILLVSALFSLAGFTNAMIARTFDDIMLIPTFILTPLAYLGGVFYSITMLPPFWKTISYFNPIFYMVSALRHVMLNSTEENSFGLSLTIIFGTLGFLTVLNLVLLKREVGLRD